MNIVTDITQTAFDALRDSAVQNGRSVEEEASLMLQLAVLEKLPMGTALRELGRLLNITDEFEGLRDRSPARAASFD